MTKVRADLAIEGVSRRCRQALGAFRHARKDLGEPIAMPALKDIQGTLIHSLGASVDGSKRGLEDIPGRVFVQLQLIDEDAARHLELSWPFLDS